MTDGRASLAKGTAGHRIENRRKAVAARVPQAG